MTFLGIRMNSLVKVPETNKGNAATISFDTPMDIPNEFLDPWPGRTTY